MRVKQIKEAACFLAGNLTETGFLDITLEQACMLHQVPVQVMERGLQVITTARNPPGIGARNLQECLDIQIRRDPTAPSLASVIVNEHFLDLAYGRWDHIRKKQPSLLSKFQRPSHIFVLFSRAQDCSMETHLLSRLYLTVKFIVRATEMSYESLTTTCPK